MSEQYEQSDEELEGPDDEDSDVLLSDEGFEDKQVDDLLEFVDHNLREVITRGLGGLNGKQKSEGGDKEDEDGDGRDCDIGNDVELNDSDGEVVSVIGSDDERPHYPLFNPEVDFNGKIVLSKGLRFPSP